MIEPILVGDFGGTNARVALVERDGSPFEIRTYPSNDFATGTAVIERYLRDVGRAASDRVRGCCIAIAGPVDDGRGRLTNGRIECDARDIERALRFDHALVINDFTAVGHALPELPTSALRTIGPDLHGVGTIAALGPGTGLGMGIVVPDGRTWRVLPSEGGHGNLAPSDPLEVEVLGHLMQRFDFVDWETVLSGPGLVNLYRAVCDVWGTAPTVDDPSAITARGVTIEDPVCHQTLETFCNLLGTAAGDLAMTVCATGGVHIAGGIVPRIGDFVAQSQFRRRFDARGPMSYYVKAIPTYLVLEADLGLLGAAAGYRHVYS